MLLTIKYYNHGMHSLQINSCDIYSHMSDNVTGLIMVKPHAVEVGMHDDVKAMLSGNFDIFPKLILPDSIKHNIKKRLTLKCEGSIDLSSNNGAIHPLLDIFYSGESHMRYYPALIKAYSGIAYIFGALYDGNHEELQSIFKQLKGFRPIIHDGVIQPGYGVRGLLLPPIRIIDDEELGGFDTGQYNHYITPVVNNGIHTTDSQVEASRSIECFLNSQTDHQVN